MPVALQMLIENAIKHNTASKAKPLKIKIYCDDDDNIIVQNNIQLKKLKETSTQVGLKNIAQRYRIITNKEIIVKESEQDFTVVLPLIGYTDENNNN